MSDDENSGGYVEAPDSEGKKHNCRALSHMGYRVRSACLTMLLLFVS